MAEASEGGEDEEEEEEGEEGPCGSLVASFDTSILLEFVLKHFLGPGKAGQQAPPSGPLLSAETVEQLLSVWAPEMRRLECLGGGPGTRQCLTSSTKQCACRYGARLDQGRASPVCSPGRKCRGRGRGAPP